ncbi:MAG: sulfite exporter TauE/SafE family protein [Actinomycetota bacterium]|nr:sulfite exporter TauE/SafE family protein [Actinomycetota bacterium]
MDAWQLAIVGLAVAASFGLSASAGLGGSLILVPALSIAFGAKEGVAMAALLLAGNNVVKVVAYRQTLPFRQSLIVMICIAVGAWIGAQLLVAAPESVIRVAVLLAMGGTLLAERLRLTRLRQAGGPTLSLASGATSGFSGMSGPLKGVAIRNLGLDRLHMVGAASLASLAGDATKATVFIEANILDAQAITTALSLTPLMIAATFTGRLLNRRLGERGYAALFWVVMGGYSARVVLT